MNKIILTTEDAINQASLVAQMVKNMPAMWETWAQSRVAKIPCFYTHTHTHTHTHIFFIRSFINGSLGCFSEKEMATHSSILAWRIPGMGEPGGLLPMGSHRVGHD